jgi:transketolase
VRSAFISTLVELAERDQRVVLLTGDLGFTVLEPFAERFPDRFFNAVVAEQNMVGVATGLAEAGYTPYAYSIATFASMRAYEFIRNGPVLHRLPVRIVGVGGGMDYGHNGMTHFALEDVAIMRVQPALTVVAPADPEQARTALIAVQDLPGPVYLRLGKASTPVPGLNGRFALGRAELIGTGEDVALVALGPMAAPAIEAAELLGRRGVSATVAIVTSLNPSPVDDLANLFGAVPLVLATEAHYENGGLGSLAAEIIAEHGLGCRLVRAGVRSMPAGVTGSTEYMFDRFGLSAERLADAAMLALAAA